MAATSDYVDLAKVGIEAFALLEEHQRQLKHARTRQVLHNHNHNYGYNNGREVTDCNQAAKKYGGLVIVEHRGKKKPAPQPAIFKLY
ncbi:hypothetical protein TorRG33x02_075340 [Trema orientale]|uniref:Uncharacterized protein n=1 Tax=Trema orientale TaxID=63057 RepID=A0A2P5FFI5_TREOI|nr:hypothetical protein TorRG33x02_075340 [Trema orientale]